VKAKDQSHSVVWFEFALNALETAIQIGLVTAASAAVFFGKIYLALILLLIAVGIFLRLKRKKRNNKLAH
jgi:hypothetical protein